MIEELGMEMQSGEAEADDKTNCARQPMRPLTDESLWLEGASTTSDEGNRTARMAIGLGFGRGKLQTSGFVYQGVPPNHRQVGRFETTAKSSMKPGVGPIGAAGGSVAVATAGAAVSEKFLTSGHKGPVGTAKKIAKMRLAAWMVVARSTRSFTESKWTT